MKTVGVMADDHLSFTADAESEQQTQGSLRSHWTASHLLNALPLAGHVTPGHVSPGHVTRL